jgi:hypothetical protein
MIESGPKHLWALSPFRQQCAELRSRFCLSRADHWKIIGSDQNADTKTTSDFTGDYSWCCIVCFGCIEVRYDGGYGEPLGAVGLAHLGWGLQTEAREFTVKSSEPGMAIDYNHNNGTNCSHILSYSQRHMSAMADTSNGTISYNGTHMDPKLLWKHSNPESTPMHKYLQEVNRAYNLQLSTYQELHRWSTDNIDAFWQSVWKFVGVRAEGDASQVSQSILHRDLKLLTTAGSRSRCIHVSAT